MADFELHFSQGRIRRWRNDEADTASLVRYADNRNVSRNLRDVFPFPYTEADAHAFLASTVERPLPGDLAIEVGGEAIGGIGLRLHEDVYRGTAEIGYWLAEPFWGRGIATEAVRTLTTHALPTYGLRRIEAHVFAPNAASARVLEKAGYVLEGRLRRQVIKDGEVMDALLYAIVAPD